jgi:hypothetical protein
VDGSEEFVRRQFGDVPLEVIEQRASLWPVVNWLLPIMMRPPTGNVDYFGLRGQPLPTVPRQGEWLGIDALRARVEVERVQWGSDGRVMAKLGVALLDPDQLDLLRAEGWDIFPPQQAEDWLADLVGD